MRESIKEFSLVILLLMKTMTDWKDEPSSMTQREKLESSLRYVVSLGKVSRSEFLAKYGITGTLLITPENVTKGMAYKMIKELEPMHYSNGFKKE